MANAKGGFSRAPRAGGLYAPWGGLDHHPHWNPGGDRSRFQQQPRQPTDQPGAPQAGIYDLASPAGVPAAQPLTAFQLAQLGDVKTEPDSLSSMLGSISATAPGTTPVDPSLGPLPAAGAETRTLLAPLSTEPLTPSTATLLSQQQVPSAPQSSSAGFSPSGLSFLDLQDMDFLQQGAGAGPGGGPVPAAADPGAQMDLGFGLGWEGLDHDFSDGQQLDLFDGFFFGGQQGAGAGGV